MSVKPKAIPVYFSNSSAFVDVDRALELRAHSDKLMECIDSLFKEPIAKQKAELLKELEALEADIKIYKEELQNDKA